MHIPGLARLKELLSKPWMGPSIGLVVLAVGVASYLRQGARWEAEDRLRDPHPVTGWSHELVEGKYRTLAFNTNNSLANPIRLISIEALTPAGAMVAPYADYGSRKLNSKPSAVAVVNRTIQANGGDSFYIAWRDPKTPNDQGDFVELRANYEEVSARPRQFFQMVRIYVPQGADKQ